MSEHQARFKIPQSLRTAGGFALSAFVVGAAVALLTPLLDSVDARAKGGYELAAFGATLFFLAGALFFAALFSLLTSRLSVRFLAAGIVIFGGIALVGLMMIAHSTREVFAPWAVVAYPCAGYAFACIHRLVQLAFVEGGRRP